MKSILIVTDAWHPQINGVVRSLANVADVLSARGFDLHYLTPSDYHTIPLPGYNEIRLSLTPPGDVGRTIRDIGPDAIHIATEGPLGTIARRYCVKNDIPFATSFHTQFPEYLRLRAPVPEKWTYAYLRKFHGAAEFCLVPSRTVAEQLKARGFKNVVVWSRGVELELFDPARRDPDFFAPDLKPPFFLYVGRVAVEKNIEAFLELELPGTKIVVGDGPQRTALESQYTDVVFVGPKKGEELARYYASADCFVFPSRTDTFGLVMLEALASGVPVAAFPVQGPLDVVGDSGVGVLDDDLQKAALEALTISRQKCRDYAARFTWDASADQFLAHLPIIPVEQVS